jgi:hypothetical protein
MAQSNSESDSVDEVKYISRNSSLTLLYEIVNMHSWEKNLHFLVYRGGDDGESKHSTRMPNLDSLPNSNH